ncbi:MAG: TIGR02302 family protein [Rhodospirillaceae bacterium TMED8]|nr:TIGR02302 family protein [Magnetovibrio sp.]OUT49877.1 MAG: TIGR02302 family protein [Rhodospirillaceae bacterium TMED8]
MMGAHEDKNLKKRGSLRLTLLIWWSRAAILWERVWLRSFPITAIFCLFSVITLFDVLPTLPSWLHFSILAALAGLLIWATIYFLKGDFKVSVETGRKRLERDSGVKHQPLTAFNDRPVLGVKNSASRFLWAAHVARTQPLLRQLKFFLPAPRMARHDPYGLRVLIPLTFLVALSVGAEDAAHRFERAINPKVEITSLSQPTIDVWVRPPEYTKVPPRLLHDSLYPKKEGAVTTSNKHESHWGDLSPQMSEGVSVEIDKVIGIPMGSMVLAQIGRAGDNARIRIGERTKPFLALDPKHVEDGSRAEIQITHDDLQAQTLDVKLGDSMIGSWPIKIIEDYPPRIEFTGPSRNMGNGILQVQFEASDDYSLSDVRLEIKSKEGLSALSGNYRSSFALPVPRADTGGKGQAKYDFSDHPWSGLQVQLSLLAVDVAGQESRTDDISIALPERTFNHPVARELIAARKKLNQPTVDLFQEVQNDLLKIVSKPSHFFNDTVTFLAIALSYNRLRHGIRASNMVRPEVQRLLWQTALRIEGGEFAVAEQALRDLQGQIKKALNGRGTEQEIERLLDQLKSAINNYMRAMADHLKRQGREIPGDLNSSAILESGDLQRMLEKARQLSRSGSRAAARRVLSELDRMLNALRDTARFQPPLSRKNTGRQMLQGLRDLSRRQKDLLDLTFKRQHNLGDLRTRRLQKEQDNQLSQRSGAKKPSDESGQGNQLSRNQRDLRKALGRFIIQMDKMLGMVPSTMKQADQAMKGAGEALKQNNISRASRDQIKALEALRQSAERLARKLSNRARGAGVGAGLSRAGKPFLSGRDPFGRQPGSGVNGAAGIDGAAVPTKRELFRAREIMDELRRRSGEHNRPQLERDYIERLIKRF